MAADENPTPQEPKQKSQEGWPIGGQLGVSERFFPDFILREAIAALAIFGILLTITVLFPAPLEPEADPTSHSYLPMPDWYFYWLYQLLKYFPSWLRWGAIVVPLILVIILGALPWLDRSRKRRPLQRPVWFAISIVVVLGLIGLTFQAWFDHKAEVAAAGGQPGEVTNASGQQLYAQYCASCHGDKFQGGVGPALDKAGTFMTAEGIAAKIQDPSTLMPPNETPKMPKLPLSSDQAQAVAQYILQSTSK
ncbi:MAG: c-type cytochrome [Firmicutes bacterium]|nr:c-type cytochrome [Bacillota bacterium]